MKKASTTLLEDTIAEEEARKLLAAQARLKNEMQELLDNLRPGLSALLRDDGFTLYAWPGALFVEHGYNWGILTAEQLQQAAERGGTEVLQQFEAIKSGRVATSAKLHFWFKAGLSEVWIALIFNVFMWELLPVVLALQAGVIVIVLCSLSDIYPKLRAYAPWKWQRCQAYPEPAAKLI